MGERNVVRTAEVYRAYSGIAAATVSGVLRMSPMGDGARAIDVGGVAVAQRGVADVEKWRVCQEVEPLEGERQVAGHATVELGLAAQAAG